MKETKKNMKGSPRVANEVEVASGSGSGSGRLNTVSSVVLVREYTRVFASPLRPVKVQVRSD